MAFSAIDATPRVPAIGPARVGGEAKAFAQSFSRSHPKPGTRVPGFGALKIPDLLFRNLLWEGLQPRCFPFRRGDPKEKRRG
ncbi:hypothetical protein [Lysobacter gummosus]|uniref:hypothetical protein n=1 Tax=Lysobacter gummosus TaxID=262324 RepID=UPI003635DD7F